MQQLRDYRSLTQPLISHYGKQNGRSLQRREPGAVIMFGGVQTGTEELTDRLKQNSLTVSTVHTSAWTH